MRDEILMSLVDRATSDAAFRAQAQNDLEGALKQHGYDLNTEELAAVKAFHTQTMGKSDQEINRMLAGNAQQRQFT